MLAPMTADAHYLNFGAGTPAPGWLNFDASPLFALPRVFHRALALTGAAPRAAAFCAHHYRYFRLMPGRPLPIGTQTLAAIYCSHVLEHLPAAAVPGLLDEFHRVLRPGGHLRILVPDLEASMQTLLAQEAPLAAIDTALGTLPTALGGGGTQMLRTRIRAALEGFHGFPSCHRTAYLKEPFRAHLATRWGEPRVCGYGDSAMDPARLAAVEQASRCEGALVWELTRPDAP